MVRFWSILIISFFSTTLLAQQFSVSLGLNTGITSSRTIDDGIDRDPRYRQYYNVKLAPIALNLGINYEFVGLMVSPGIINIGQNAYLLNASGGQEGLRSINERYLNVPVAFKVHLVNLAFLKISGIASLSAAYLLDGKETITHNDSKLDFPKEVYPILPADYKVEYDGVAAPTVAGYIMANKNDFRQLQVFAGAGLQSDWDITNHWRVTFDLRVNYGLFDPRSSDYLSRLDSRQTLYDMPGTRHDVFAQLSVGISRYFEFDKNDQDRKKKLKGSKKGYRVKTVSKVRTTRPR